jgi:hypothetical protein
MSESPRQRPAHLETDPVALLEVAGGMSAISVALAIWIHDQRLGPLIANRPLLVPAFLPAGLAALFSAIFAFGILLERERARQGPGDYSLTYSLLLFLALNLVILVGSFMVLLFSLAP